MIELTVFAYLIAHGALWFVLIGFVVYVVYLILFGKIGNSSSPSQSSSSTSSSNSTSNSNSTSSSNTVNNKAPAKRNFDGYVKHGDTIPMKLFGVRDKKNRPNSIDCYDERWDDNTGHFYQLFTYEKPLIDFEPKYVETDSIHIEDSYEHIKMLEKQYENFLEDNPTTLNDYKIENFLPIKVDSSIKQTKGWMVSFAMIIADFKNDMIFIPAYDLIINNKVYLHNKYKTEMVCEAYEILKEYFISDVKDNSKELNYNHIATLWFIFEHSDEDYFDFVKKYNFDPKYIDTTRKISSGLSAMFNSDADLILKFWNDSNIQKDDIYYYGVDHKISSDVDMEVRYYAIVREVPLTH